MGIHHFARTDFRANPCLSTKRVLSPSLVLRPLEEKIHGFAFRRLARSGFGKRHPGHGILNHYSLAMMPGAKKLRVETRK